MPDPLSITTGVLSLLGVAWNISVELKKFHDDASVVNKTVANLENDVEGLRHVLESMRDTFENITAEHGSGTGHIASHWRNLARSIDDGKSMLDRLSEQIVDINKSKSFMDGPRKQLRLNMAQDKLSSFRIHIQSYRDGLQLSLQTIILWNQVSYQQTADQVLPNLSDLHVDVRRIAADINQRIEALKSMIQTPQDEAEVISMHNLRECVKSAASIVSSASTIVANQQGDAAISGVPASDFGDCFPVENLAIRRWVDSKTIYEYSEANFHAPPQSIADVPGFSDNEESSDSDTDLDTEITSILLEDGKRKLAAGDLKAAERMLKNCMTRMTAIRAEKKNAAAHFSGHLEVVGLLFEMYKSQGNLQEAQRMLQQRMTLRERTLGKKDAVFLQDVLHLAKLLEARGDVLEAQLHARRALKGFRKAGDTSDVRECLVLLVELCGENVDDREAYNMLLWRVDRELTGNTLPLTKSLRPNGLSTPALTSSTDDVVIGLNASPSEDSTITASHSDEGRESARVTTDSLSNKTRQESREATTATETPLNEKPPDISDVTSEDSLTIGNESSPPEAVVKQVTSAVPQLQQPHAVTNEDHVVVEGTDSNEDNVDFGTVSRSPSSRTTDYSPSLEQDRKQERVGNDLSPGRPPDGLKPNISTKLERRASLTATLHTSDDDSRHVQDREGSTDPGDIASFDRAPNLSKHVVTASPASRASSLYFIAGHIAFRLKPRSPWVQAYCYIPKWSTNLVYQLAGSAKEQAHKVFVHDLLGADIRRSKEEDCFCVEISCPAINDVVYLKFTDESELLTWLDKLRERSQSLRAKVERQLPLTLEVESKDEPSSKVRASQSVSDVNASLMVDVSHSEQRLDAANLAKVPGKPFHNVDNSTQGPTNASAASIAEDSVAVPWYIPLPPPTKRKVVIVGPGGAGKTALLLRGCRGEYPDTYILPTIIDNYTMYPMVKGRAVELALWDTAGIEGYDRMRALAYPNAHCIVVCFDINDPNSLENVEVGWMPEELEHYCKGVPILLVGCQADLSSDAEHAVELSGDNVTLVGHHAALAVRDKLGAQYLLYCSAKTGKGVEEVFEHAAEIALSHSYKKGKLVRDGEYGHRKRRSLFRLFGAGS